MNGYERETYEDRLNRMFAGWTDDEVALMFSAIRDGRRALTKSRGAEAFETFWREYAKRTFPENVVCKRCGSDNHTAENHPE